MTLRETTRLFISLFNAKTVAIWLGASFVATMAGPFGTLQMSLAPRAVYWFAAIGLAIAMTSAIIPRAYEKLPFQPTILRGLAGAIGFSVVYAAILTGFGKVFFENSGGFPGYPLMLLYVAPVAVMVTGIVHLFITEAETRTENAPSPAPAPPKLLKRMKPALGDAFVRLSMQDHYVEVVTRAGSQLILMRFADALEEIEGAAGWRVHRSHWIAESEIRAVKREAGKVRLLMSDGFEAPVSRTYAPALRRAGVFKRFE